MSYGKIIYKKIENMNIARDVVLELKTKAEWGALRWRLLAYQALN